MKKVYIIPGFLESASFKRYKKVIELLWKKDFIVIGVRIDWKKQSMHDYVEQFLKTMPEKNSYILGFSYGAMIALLSARKVKPKILILCSMSPYFKEDLDATISAYGKKLEKHHTKRLLEGFKKYPFGSIARHVMCKTVLIAGDKETVIRGKNYRLVLNRAKDANAKIKNSQLIIVKNGKHDIAQKEYNAALRKVINKL